MLWSRNNKFCSFYPQLRTIWCCTFLFEFMAHLPSFLKLSITSFHKNWLLLKILNLGQLMTHLHFLCIASMIVDLTKMKSLSFRKRFWLFTWKSKICSSFNSPKAMPPDINTVAVSGTLNTFHPKFSKKVANLA